MPSLGEIQSNNPQILYVIFEQTVNQIHLLLSISLCARGKKVL